MGPIDNLSWFLFLFVVRLLAARHMFLFEFVAFGTSQVCDPQCYSVRGPVVYVLQVYDASV